MDSLFSARFLKMITEGAHNCALSLYPHNKINEELFNSVREYIKQPHVASDLDWVYTIYQTILAGSLAVDSYYESGKAADDVIRDLGDFMFRKSLDLDTNNPLFDELASMGIVFEGDDENPIINLKPASTNDSGITFRSLMENRAQNIERWAKECITTYEIMCRENGGCGYVGDLLDMTPTPDFMPALQIVFGRSMAMNDIVESMIILYLHAIKDKMSLIDGFIKYAPNLEILVKISVVDFYALYEVIHESIKAIMGYMEHKYKHGLVDNSDIIVICAYLARRMIDDNIEYQFNDKSIENAVDQLIDIFKREV